MLAKTPKLQKAPPKQAGKSANGRSRSEFVALIQTEWRKQIDGVFAVGLLLEAAKEELPHGEWGLMFQNKELPFGQNTAGILMKIADNANLRNSDYSQNLPASWRTLYELTKLPDELFIAAIADGRIHAGMEQKHAVALHKGPPASRAKAKAVRSANPNRVLACSFDIEQRIDEVFYDLEEEERADLISLLEQHVVALRKRINKQQEA